MAIKLYENYVNVIPPSGDYPFGSFKNETAPGNLDGTPVERKWADDIQGLLQRLINQSGVIVSGVPDTVSDSDYMTALLRLFELRSTYIDSGSANIYQVVSSSGSNVSTYTSEMIVRFRPVNTNTGPSTLEIESLGAKSIVYFDGTAIDAGVLVAGRYSTFVFDSSNDWFILLNVTPFEVRKGVNSISGLVPTPNPTDFEHDVIFQPGAARAANTTLDIGLASNLIKKLDAGWIVGNNEGGLFSGSMTANTTYHLAVILKDSDGSVDAGFSTDINFSDRPVGYTSYRRIGSLVTNSSADLRYFYAREFANGAVHFGFNIRHPEYFGTLTSDTGQQIFFLAAVPDDIEAVAHLGVYLRCAGDNQFAILMMSPTYEASAVPIRPVSLVTSETFSLVASDNGRETAGNFDIQTSTSAGIQYRLGFEGAPSYIADMAFHTIGYTDRRVV